MQTSLSPHVNPAADSEPGYGQLFAVLIRRFPWFLIVFLASVGAGYYVYRKRQGLMLFGHSVLQ